MRAVGQHGSSPRSRLTPSGSGAPREGRRRDCLVGAGWRGHAGTFPCRDPCLRSLPVTLFRIGISTQPWMTDPRPAQPREWTWCVRRDHGGVRVARRDPLDHASHRKRQSLTASALGAGCCRARGRSDATVIDGDEPSETAPHCLNRPRLAVMTVGVSTAWSAMQRSGLM